MKSVLPFLLLVLLSCTALAQTSETAPSTSATMTQSAPAAQPAPAAAPLPQERLFFPKDWYWGWAEFDLAPPHNEIDPNLCAATLGSMAVSTHSATPLRATSLQEMSRFVPSAGRLPAV